ncbi:hypothetical protein [Flavobacterium sp. J27]|uniref:hypothetical protein n=1 Tax=Flavobacterium sp. J27 TaxID=2060419 RepID=UPI001030FFEF|nr:hypothetical protein [Flavobacterium sp. J27]
MASTSTYKFTTEELFSNTNGGLDIIFKYLPQSIGCENDKKKFKYRETEKTPSCVLSKKEGIWFVVDFGGKSYSAVSVVMDLIGLEFRDALQHLYAEFNLSENNTFFKATVEVKENTKKDKDYFSIKFKEKYENLNVVGRFLTTETAKEYNFYEVEYYEKVITKKDTGKLALIKVIANETYPIFAYTPNPKEWVKLYCPRDKKYKHSYLGTKPERYVHGLDRFLKKCQALENKIEKEEEKIAKAREKGEERSLVLVNQLRKDLEQQKVFIATGGSDGLNIASIGNSFKAYYNVIWFNSESEQITYSELQQIKQYTKKIYNIPDIDKSGKKYGYDVAKSFWTLKSIWLPADRMTANGKDFRNWLDYYKNADITTITNQFENLIAGALQCKFFDCKIAKNGSATYKINLSNLHYFLNVHNFYSYKIEHKHIDVASEEQLIFIRIEGNIVYKVMPREIRRFCLAYVKEKGQPLDVANMILSTPYFNENHLLGLEDIKLNFQSFDANTQYFFFANQVAKITPEEVELKKHGDFENHAWSKQIIKHTIFKEDKFFKHYKDGLNNDRIEILRKDCQFMNYLMNASRVYWKKELEDSFQNEVEAEKYHNENRFNLNGKNLTEEEQIIQEKHFLNKCFSLGYLLHRYKQEDFAKCLYVMDDTPKESDEDANGRTGKSVMLRGIDKLLQNRFLIDGKNKSITQDRHIFHGLQDTSEYIQIDDADKYLDFKFFYTKITNSIIVNPKNSQPYEIPFDIAPKIVYITNYGMPNMTGSDFGRILFVSFSDYYHAKTEHYQQERRISYDFGGKNLFQDWDKKQWNIFYNFMLQCCQLYLQHRGNEFQAPQDNITINNLRASMGDNFEEWANSYFHEENLNVNIIREDLMQEYSRFVGGKTSKSAKGFKTSLLSFCKINGYTLNPKEMQKKDGRIKINVLNEKTNKTTTKECFFIKTKDAVIKFNTPEEEKEPETDLFTKEKHPNDDLPL